MTTSVIFTDLLIGAIMLSILFAILTFTEKTSKSTPMSFFVIVMVYLMLLSASFLMLSETASSKIYQLKLNNEGHTAYSMRTGSDLTYDIYKVITNHNKEITVDNPDDIVYNKTEKSTLKIKTITSYLPVFGHKIKTNINKTQKLYIIK